MNTSRGKLVIISGPSGAGKSTVVKQLLREAPVPLVLSISATTRPPRPGEQHGRDYFFLSHEDFARQRQEGRFLECKEVFGQNWYGTPRQQVESGLAAGKWVLLEIDVEGATTVVQQLPEAITIFLHPGSTEELERRLRARASDSEEAIQRRLEVAQCEMSQKDRYRFEVVNQTVPQAVADICDLLKRCGEESC